MRLQRHEDIYLPSKFTYMNTEIHLNRKFKKTRYCEQTNYKCAD